MRAASRLAPRAADTPRAGLGSSAGFGRAAERAAGLPAPAAALIAAALLPAALAACPARAQDFRAPAMAGPADSPLVLLEDGLCRPARAAADSAGGAARPRFGVRAEAAATRWFGLPDLTSRALALGAAHRSGGLALRAVARRDRGPQPSRSPLGPGTGAEAGFGAWLGAGPGLTLWADAPQLWMRGLAPPLRRPLEFGVALESGGLAGWWKRRAPGPADGSPGERSAGLGLIARRWSAWVEARDRPLRAGAGLAVRAGPTTAGFGIESHPVLGETVRLSLGIGAGK